ncbi:MAG: PDZ domain-containing protein, partial [Gemmataceae bacterium]
MRVLRLLAASFFATSTVAFAAAPETAPAPRPWIDLSSFKTTSNLIKADPKAFAPRPEALPGYLGVQLGEKGNEVRIEALDDGAPADQAGLKVGDHITEIGGKPVENLSGGRALLRGRFAGESLAILVDRGGDFQKFTVILRPVSKPMKASMERPILGVQFDTSKPGGLTISSVTAGGPAEKAGLKPGDVLKRLGSLMLENDTTFRDALGLRQVGETITLGVLRGKDEIETRVVLASDANASRTRATGWDDRPNTTTFKKPVYRLAIVGVEYPDVKHLDKATPRAWEESLFSKNSYVRMSATGQRVFGSMNDYYHELSYGQIKVEGAFIGWVEAAKKKAEYNLGSSVSSSDKSKYFAEVMEKVTAKFGKDSVKGFDGVFFIYAGERVNTSRGGLYWPHRAS